ncbi:MAG: toxin TcdB middle/N-terminal domain-containing protein, partial [Myxococcota bacterium]
PDLAGDTPVLVRSTELHHDEQPHLTKLEGVSHKGYRSTPAEVLETPRVQFTYQTAALGEAVELVRGIDDVGESFEVGAWQWVDLDGEGLSGLLTEQAGAWYYKRNEGQGELGPVRRLGERPQLGLGGLQLLDLGGDGRLDLVSFRPPMAGHYERTDDGRWGDFHYFRSVPNVDPSDPNVRMVDLDGDGHADLLVTEDEVLRWYPSKAKEGFDESRTARKARDEEDGPTLVFANEGESIFLADMTGDGLSDLVRVRASAVCYWPNRGYGRFGAKVVMAAPPRFDHPDRFDPRRLRFADLDGSGPTDLVYVGPEAVTLWFNQSGNGWSAAQVVERMAGVDDAATVQVTDLRGDGTACLVWSSPLLGNQAQPLRYLRLMAQGKPHLLSQIDNGMGRVTTMTYASSTEFYVADRRAGTPWATRLPFPVQVLAKVEVVDRFSGWRFANTYTYHHGYFDGVEREFRGFGRVEQRDTESIADFEGAPSQVAHHVAPVVTRTWFHTGAWMPGEDLQATYAAEGFQGDASAPVLAPSSLPAGLAPEEAREATRALRGQRVRQEVYAEDAIAPDKPYVVTTTRYAVQVVQPRSGHRHGVYLRVPAESRTANYERSDDDPRVAHELVLQTDAYGQVIRSATVAYPRRSPAFPQQGELHVVVTERTLLHDDDRANRDQLHLSVVLDERAWELTKADFGQTDTA